MMWSTCFLQTRDPQARHVQNLRSSSMFVHVLFKTQLKSFNSCGHRKFSHERSRPHRLLCIQFRAFRAICVLLPTTDHASPRPRFFAQCPKAFKEINEKTNTKSETSGGSRGLECLAEGLRRKRGSGGRCGKMNQKF